MLCLLLFVIFEVFAAQNDWDDAAVYITYNHGRRGVFCAKLDKGECHLSDGDVCDVLKEQMLAGFYFLESVDCAFWTNPLFWEEGVRAVACYKRPFFSQEIKACFEAISRLDQEKNVRGRKALTQECVQKYIYPPRYTRLWSVVSQEIACKALKRGFVLVRFQGVKDALMGELCLLDQEYFDDPASVLSIKRQQHEEGALVPQAPCMRAAALAPQKFWDICLPSQRGVGLIYFPRDGSEKVSMLFDLPKDSIKVDVTCRGEKFKYSHNNFDYLREEVLRAYVLNKPSCDAIDVDSIKQPPVCDALCHKVSFQSNVLRSDLEDLQNYLRYQHYIASVAGWGGLTCAHFDEFYSERETLQWYAEEKENVTPMFEGRLKPPTPGTLFVLIQGEHVILQGTPMFVHMELRYDIPSYSLAFYRLDERRRLCVLGRDSHRASFFSRCFGRS